MSYTGRPPAAPPSAVDSLSAAYGHVPLQNAKEFVGAARHPGLAGKSMAVGPDAPVNNVPVILSNPFDFSNTTFGSLMSQYLRDKLLFEPRRLFANPLFLDTADPSVDLLNPPASAPQNGNVILQPEFRK